MVIMGDEASLVPQHKESTHLHRRQKEIRVQSLGWEDPLKEEMATHSSVLAWKVLWTEEMGGLQSMGVTKSRTQLSDGVRTNALSHTHTHTHRR